MTETHKLSTATATAEEAGDRILAHKDDGSDQMSTNIIQNIGGEFIYANASKMLESLHRYKLQRP